MTGRTRRQESLLTSPAAWGWWTDGYEHGYGHGYLAGLNAAAGVIAEHAPYKDAAALLLDALDERPIAGLADITATLAHRAAMLEPAEPTETLQERHRRVAESWGLPVEGAA